MTLPEWTPLNFLEIATASVDDLNGRRFAARRARIAYVLDAVAAGTELGKVMDAAGFPQDPPPVRNGFFGEGASRSRQQAFADWVAEEMRWLINQLERPL